MVSKFRKSANNFSTTLASGIGSTDTVMSLASVSTLPTDTEVDLVIDRVNASGTRTPSAREYVKGTVSGSTITTMTRGLGGSSALTHNSGAVVEAVVNAQTQNDMVDGIAASLNQADGSLKVSAVTTALNGATVTNLSSTTPTLTSPKVITAINDTNGNALWNVTATASAVNQFTNANAATGNGPTLSATGTDSNIDINLTPKGTGSVKANGNKVVTYLGSTSQTVDHNTGSVSTQVDISGFSLTFTVPGSTARNVKLTLSVDSVTNSSGTGTDTTLRLREGATVLCDRAFSAGNGNRTPAPSLVYVGSFTAGSHTVQVSTQNAIATAVRYDFSANCTGLLEAELLG